MNQIIVFGATLLPVIAVGAFALVVFAAVGRTSVPLVRTASHVGMRSLPTILLGSSSLLLVDTSPRPYLAGASQPRRFIGSHTVAAMLVAGTAGWVQTGRWAAYLRAHAKSQHVASLLAIAFVVIAGAGASSGVISATPWTPPERSSPNRPLNVMLIGIDRSERGLSLALWLRAGDHTVPGRPGARRACVHECVLERRQYGRRRCGSG